LIRSIKGKEMFADALYNGGLQCISRQSAQERAGERQRIVSLVEEFAELKKRRGEATLERLRAGGA
jgi:coenzyme F420-reducing hydrogenase beta subunit